MAPRVPNRNGTPSGKVGCSLEGFLGCAVILACDQEAGFVLFVGVVLGSVIKNLALLTSFDVGM